VVVFGLVAAPLALAPVVEPFFLWYAVAPLAVFVVLVYAASKAYGLLWGFLFVVGSLWLHVIILAAVDLLTGGLLSQAFDMGFDVYVRWNVPLIAFMDVSSLYISCRAVKHLLAYVRRRRG
jgi:apolipoprotein N-acyltransferase